MKPWYKSQTIVNASAGFVIAIASIVHTCIAEERKPNEAEVGTVLGLAYTLKQTIEGRLKAKEGIGKPAKPVEPPKFEIDYSYLDKKPEEPKVELPPLEVEEFIDNEEEDYLDIDFDTLKGTYTLIAKQDTKLKNSWEDTSELELNQYVEVKEAAEFKIDSWRFCNPKNGHIVTVVDEYPGVNFFVFAPHWKLINDLDKEVDINNAFPEKEKPPEVKKNLGQAFNLPGFDSKFYMNDFIAGTHFTHAEFWRNGERIPYKKSQVEYGITLAKLLNELRERLGNTPMIITSAYRPGPGSPQGDVNGHVGGARNSEHTFEHGAAVDFYCPGKSVHSIYPVVERFCREKGLSLGDTRTNPRKNFIHLGYRNGWDKKYRYWNY